MTLYVARLDRFKRRFASRLWLLLLIFPLTVVVLSWLLTAPLNDASKPKSVGAGLSAVQIKEHGGKQVDLEKAKASAEWPLVRLEGRAAKLVLLDVLVAAAERLDRVDGYTATFHKQERIKGRLGPPQTLSMKLRHHPFAIYFKFLSPVEGKEVVYADGQRGNKMIAHSAGAARFLVPRLALPPDHPIALADSRHAVTDAGIVNLTARLIHYRQLDLDDPMATTVLDRVKDARGQSRLRSIHAHPHPQPDRPFARVEVLYDPHTFFPVDIRNFDWPQDENAGDLLLAEHYAYENIQTNVTLGPLDFDPSNPEYQFQRY